MNNSIKSISRSGTTFTATRNNNTTFTFNQQDNNTTYEWTYRGASKGTKAISLGSSWKNLFCIVYYFSDAKSTLFLPRVGTGDLGIYLTGYPLLNGLGTRASVHVTGTSVNLTYYWINGGEQTANTNLQCWTN